MLCRNICNFWLNGEKREIFSEKYLPAQYKLEKKSTSIASCFPKYLGNPYDYEETTNFIQVLTLSILLLFGVIHNCVCFFCFWNLWIFIMWFFQKSYFSSILLSLYWQIYIDNCLDVIVFLHRICVFVFVSYYRLFFLRSIAQFLTQIYMNCLVSS